MIQPSSDSKRIAFIQACWHRDIVDQLRDSFAKEFATLSDLTVDFFELPGAYEIPLHAKALANTGKYAGVVAAGLVVDGGIYRHDFVATAVIDGRANGQRRAGILSRANTTSLSCWRRAYILFQRTLCQKGS